MIYLALGALRADERFDNPYTDNLYHEMIVNHQLKQEVASICTAHFGLSKQEAEQCVNSYSSDYLKRQKLQTHTFAKPEDLQDFLHKDQG